MDDNLLSLCYILSSSILLISSLIHSSELFSIKYSLNRLIYFSESETSETQIINLYKPSIRNRFHITIVILSLIELFLLYNQPLSLLYKIFFLCLTFLHLYSYAKRKIGRDGADQIRLLAFMSFSLGFLASNDLVEILPLYFIGFQLLISYSTSGLSKLFSTHWRKGNVLGDILMTNSYGSKSFAKYLKSNPIVEKTFSYSAIFFMLFVPISFFVPISEIFYLSLLGMFIFHISTAVLMGLNDFLFTIPMTYPAVYYLYFSFHQILL
ncbi:hypothetical protein KCTC32516_02411 [Polaribacter huanghezhanensis]|uniref:hypothetical protein n=1 Tax=Polaribacter huanghezhanensis TaxID=1354726 RepID=UPI002647D0B1|nr:hypothetical protein [Polaribacter huanghezhanensis]WKD87031.1 hypothetical protein KCTC32516_02411 [Polaribacter huanghezhanensis]